MYINREFVINSFMTEVPLKQSKSMGWFLYDRDLHHEKVNPLNVTGFCLYSMKNIRTPLVI